MAAMKDFAIKIEEVTAAIAELNELWLVRLELMQDGAIEPIMANYEVLVELKSYVKTAITTADEFIM
jgi:hypothetical protein